jgi:N6-adenosine-specific RNA methylase IME4
MKLDRAKNDFSQHFVDSRQRPANFIRDSNLTDRFDEYPKLKELIEAKDERIATRASPAMFKKVDLRSFDLTTLGTKFDVVLIDPPWEEYRRRAAAAGGLEDEDDAQVWSPKDIMSLRIEAITETPSFCFLWCGTGQGLEWGRHCLKKWGFRRCEDITWIKSNRVNNRNPDFLPNSVVMPTSEHCLVGIKGTVRRNYDGHIIHANVDTDVMVGEEPPYGDTAKPDELYSIIEHFCNCRRRLELFGRDNNIRPGWLTLGDELSSSNHQAAAWAANFAGTVASLHEEGDEEITLPNHLLGTTPLIESLRPKSPTQLREEAERRQGRELKRRDDEGRAAWASESAAAAAMGITLEPYVPVTMDDLPKMQTVFHEQHPFNIS